MIGLFVTLLIDIPVRVLLVMVMKCHDDGAVAMAGSWWTLKGWGRRESTTLMVTAASVWWLWYNHGVLVLEWPLVVTERVVMKAWLLSLLFSVMSSRRRWHEAARGHSCCGRRWRFKNAGSGCRPICHLLMCAAQPSSASVTYT